MESLGSVPARPGRPLSYEGVWRFTVPAVDVSVPRTRHAVRDLLRRRRVPAGDGVVQGLLLIVSELVTNAVQHAVLLSPEIGVEVAVGAQWIRVSVEDDHPYRPTALERDHARTGGRGLLLVREITHEAGGGFDVEHTAAGGKVIWAVLPFTPPLVPPPPPRGKLPPPAREPVRESVTSPEQVL
ncbi:ATP-binding protein [Streptomyces sp. NPDC088116]|uniref:ATP-binding protein n=1 Tax=Streptomyces sp. NPDC088116 TaxID=3365825 RepID=UPI0037F421F7